MIVNRLLREQVLDWAREGIISAEQVERLLQTLGTSRVELTKENLRLVSLLAAFVFGLGMLLLSKAAPISISVRCGASLSLTVPILYLAYRRQLPTLLFLGAVLLGASSYLITQTLSLDSPDWLQLWILSLAPVAILYRTLPGSLLFSVTAIVWMHTYPPVELYLSFLILGFWLSTKLRSTTLFAVNYLGAIDFSSSLLIAYYPELDHRLVNLILVALLPFSFGIGTRFAKHPFGAFLKYASLGAMILLLFIYGSRHSWESFLTPPLPKVPFLCFPMAAMALTLLPLRASASLLTIPALFLLAALPQIQDTTVLFLISNGVMILISLLLICRGTVQNKLGQVVLGATCLGATALFRSLEVEQDYATAGASLVAGSVLLLLLVRWVTNKSLGQGEPMESYRT